MSHAWHPKNLTRQICTIFHTLKHTVSLYAFDIEEFCFLSQISPYLSHQCLIWSKQPSGQVVVVSAAHWKSEGRTDSAPETITPTEVLRVTPSVVTIQGCVCVLQGLLIYLISIVTIFHKLMALLAAVFKYRTHCTCNIISHLGYLETNHIQPSDWWSFSLL